MPEGHTDIIEQFMDYSAYMASPTIFRLWGGIALLAGALERRLWTESLRGPIYPNLYTLLVASPGVGKYIIEDVRAIWGEVRQSTAPKIPAFKVAPDSMTKASLIDTLADSVQNRMMADGKVYSYCSLLVAAEEFSVLLPAYDMEYIGVLNSIYNNKELHHERRRTSKPPEITIERPQLNILGGIQPSFLSSLIPEDGWSTGFSRRIIMVYSAEAELRSLFIGKGRDDSKRKALVRGLQKVSELYGKLKFTAEAAAELDRWHLAGGPPRPGHSKLVDYVRSRSVFIIKLAMISSVARGSSLIIELEDVVRGISWLCQAESFMPDIFRAMIGRSDNQVMEEMHFMMERYRATQRSAIKLEVLWDFLRNRVPSEKIEKIIITAERSGLIARVAGTGEGTGREAEYVPRAKKDPMLE